MVGEIGRFGGIVRVQFETLGELLRPGHVITPEVAMAMRPDNRRALESIGWVAWHTEARPEAGTGAGGPPKGGETPT